MNYFNEKSLAVRYNNYRPQFHSLIIDKIKSNCRPSFENTLDVACGTGHSSKYLKEISAKVSGIDISNEMIQEAEKINGIDYFISSAENLPFQNETFDLITVGLAFHWFNKELFLSEASRVLKDNGYLVIYNNSFSGRMINNPKFSGIIEQIYNEFPSPKRDIRKIEEIDISSFNLTNFKNESFDNKCSFTKVEFINYLLTQSNFTANTNYDDNYSLLLDKFAEYLSIQELIFNNEVNYIKKCQNCI